MNRIESAPAEEYIPSESGSNGSSARPDNTPPAIRARDEVARDRSISAGAKWFFDFLTDKTFLTNWNGDGHGRVAVCQADLVAYTGHDRKSLTEWSRQLADRGYLWIEHRAIPNAYPVNVYCIRALVPGDRKSVV